MAFNVPVTRRNLETLDNRRSYDIERFFDNFFNDFYAPFLSSDMQVNRALSPKINISETDSHYYLEAEMVGIKPSDTEIKVENNILTIQGKSEESKEQKERNYYVRERYYGSVQRSFTLPGNADSDHIDAGFENGILYIKIPKKEKETAKKIPIKGSKS